MKSLFLQILLVLFMGIFSVSMAAPVAGDIVKITHGAYGTTSGGEFIINIQNSGDDYDYIGFCLELNEWLRYNTPYNVTNVSDYSEMGGIAGAVNGRDYLSNESKWAYWMYENTNYFGPKSDALANAVQGIIWWYENEVPILHPTISEPFWNQYFSGRTDWSIGGEVYVLNMTGFDPSSECYYKQSLIFSNEVPESSTSVLFVIGLMLLIISFNYKKWLVK